ncbi:Protein of unknown function [Gryllus bimaculatus]|nr:Protein of unknown function [Gryllus bimaculatus]
MKFLKLEENMKRSALEDSDGYQSDKTEKSEESNAVSPATSDESSKDQLGNRNRNSDDGSSEGSKNGINFLEHLVLSNSRRKGFIPGRATLERAKIRQRQAEEKRMKELLKDEKKVKRSCMRIHRPRYLNQDARKCNNASSLPFTKPDINAGNEKQFPARNTSKIPDPQAKRRPSRDDDSSSGTVIPPRSKTESNGVNAINETKSTIPKGISNKNSKVKSNANNCFHRAGVDNLEVDVPCTKFVSAGADTNYKGKLPFTRRFVRQSLKARIPNIFRLVENSNLDRGDTSPSSIDMVPKRTTKGMKTSNFHGKGSIIRVQNENLNQSDANHVIIEKTFEVNFTEKSPNAYNIPNKKKFGPVSHPFLGPEDASHDVEKLSESGVRFPSLVKAQKSILKVPHTAIGNKPISKSSHTTLPPGPCIKSNSSKSNVSCVSPKNMLKHVRFDTSPILYPRALDEHGKFNEILHA